MKIKCAYKSLEAAKEEGNHVMQSKLIIKIILTILVFILWPQQLFANQIREINLDKKISQSDEIFIGEITSLKKDVIGKYAIAKSIKILKGNETEKNKKILYDFSISELNPDCCESGQKYIFFMVKAGNGLLESVNGPFGIYKIRAEYVSGWECISSQNKMLVDKALSEIDRILTDKKVTPSQSIHSINCN